MPNGQPQSPDFSDLRVRTINQAKADLPQPAYMAPGEGLASEVVPSKLSQAYDHAKQFLSTHEQHLSDKVLKPFRQGLDNMADELQQAAESGHTQSGGALTGPTRALAEGTGALLRQVPVGKDVKETIQAGVGTVIPEVNSRELAAVQEGEQLAYRARPVGQKGVLKGERPVATSSIDKAQAYKENLESMTGQPHEVVQIPLKSGEHNSHVGPNEGETWYSFKKDVSEESVKIHPKPSDFERVKPSKIKDPGGKEFSEQKYQKSYAVKVEWPDGDVLEDEVKGMNQGHALSRAKGNWEGAKNITVVRETTPERIPKVNNLRVPPERTAGVHDAPIKEGGAVPGGIQKGDKEIGIPDLALFHDPATGSTLALPTDKVSAKMVKEQIQKSRQMYFDAEDRAAAKTPERWTRDKGSMPGEPMDYLDIPSSGDYNKAKAVIVERETSKGSRFEASTGDFEHIGIFKSAEEARSAAEKYFSRGDSAVIKKNPKSAGGLAN